MNGEHAPDQETGQPDDLGRTVVRGAAFAGVGFALTQVVALVFYIGMARLAGPSVFGAFAAASVVVGVTSLFAESGMQGALIQRRDRLEEAAATAVIATFAAGILLSGVALALAPLVGLYFHSREIGLAAALMSGVLFLNAATAVPDALMQRRFSFLRRIVVDPLNMLTYGIVGTITLFYGWGIWGLVLATYVAGVVRVGSAWSLNRWRPNLRSASYGMWRELAAFGRHVVASEFLREISTIANIAILGRAFGTAPLGQFRFGQRLATQLGTPVAVASAYVLFPAFARIADDDVRLHNASRKSLRVIAVTVFPLSLALVPIGPQLAVLLLGSEWRAAGRILAALCGVTASLPLTQTASEICKAKGAPKHLPRIHAVAAISSLGLMLGLVRWGVVAVGIGLSISSILVALYALRAVATLFRTPLGSLIRELAPPAVAAFGAASVTLLVRNEFLSTAGAGLRLGLPLIVEALLMTMIYVALLAVLARSMLLETVNVLPWQRLKLPRRSKAFDS